MQLCQFTISKPTASVLLTTNRGPRLRSWYIHAENKIPGGGGGGSNGSDAEKDWLFWATGCHHLRYKHTHTHIQLVLCHIWSHNLILFPSFCVHYFVVVSSLSASAAAVAAVVCKAKIKIVNVYCIWWQKMELKNKNTQHEIYRETYEKKQLAARTRKEEKNSTAYKVENNLCIRYKFVYGNEVISRAKTRNRIETMMSKRQKIKRHKRQLKWDAAATAKKWHFTESLWC